MEELSIIINDATNLIQPNHIWMLNELHESDLLQHLGPGALVQLHLVDHLHGHLLPGEDVLGQLDHRVVTLAYGLPQVVEAGNHILAVGHYRFSKFALDSTLTKCHFHQIPSPPPDRSQYQ